MIDTVIAESDIDTIFCYWDDNIKGDKEKEKVFFDMLEILHIEKRFWKYFKTIENSCHSYTWHRKRIKARSK